VPPNCHFEIDDAEDEWIFSEKFEYIHGRALFTCFKDPKQVVAEAFKSLQPGGYLELQDMAFPFQYIGESPKDSAVYKWNEILIAGAAKGGRPWTNVQYYRQYMEEVGLVDIVEKTFYWPTSVWAKGQYFKDVAMFFQEDLLNALEGVSLKVMGLMGWSVEEILVFLTSVREDIKDTSIHAYLPM
jgi:methyltransferase family protein